MPISDDGEGGPPSKTSLMKWWRAFKSKNSVTTGREDKVFGISLQTSLVYASVAISQVGPDGKARIYGHIPVICAKTGLYLKENGTTAQGIFRVSGSNKRIKELEQIFDTPPSYGKDLVWETYSVHDAASVFRRFLNMLPEPVIPYELYTSFRDALPVTQDSIELTQAQKDTAIKQYKSLICSLPPASQHIFYYILDLLGVFARKSDVNLMPASNLATIFQPGLLRFQPSIAPIDMTEDPAETKRRIERDADEHKRCQHVLEFLIANQSCFELELPRNLRTSGASKKAAKTAQSEVSAVSDDRPISNTPLKPVQSASPVLLSTTRQRSTTDSKATLVRRGSDKSEHRQVLRRKKAEERRLQNEGAVTVKRSRTLPTSRPAPGAPGQTLSPQSNAAPSTAAPKLSIDSEKERKWWQQKHSSKESASSRSPP